MDNVDIDLYIVFTIFREAPPSVKMPTSLLSSLNVVFLPMSELLNTIEIISHVEEEME